MEMRLNVDRRETILNAAVRVFASVGFAAATMEVIAREAEMSKGGLYRHFTSKDDLFLIVMIDVLGEFRQALLSAQENGPYASGCEEIRGILAAAIGFARRRDDRVRLLLGCTAADAALDCKAPSFAEYRRLRDALADKGPSLLERGRADGSIRSDVPIEHLMATLRGALQGLFEMEIRGELVQSRLGLPEVADVDCANMIVQVLRSPS